VDVASFKSSTLTRLRPLLGNKTVLRTAAIASGKCKLTDSQVIELVSDAKAGSDEAASLAAIARYEKSHTKKLRSPKTTTQFLHALNMLSNFMENNGKPHDSFASIGISDLAKVKEIETQITGLSRRLQALKQSGRDMRKRKKVGE